MSATKNVCVAFLFILPPWLTADWFVSLKGSDMPSALLQRFCSLSIISLACLPSKCQTMVWFYNPNAYALPQCHG